MTQTMDWMKALKKYDGLRPEELSDVELEAAVVAMAALLAKLEAAEAELVAALQRAI